MESVVGVTHPINFMWFWRPSARALLGLLVLLLALGASSCAKLAKVGDASIPHLLPPTAEADFNQLIAQLKPFAELQSLRVARTELRFIEAESQERYRFDADAILVLQRPDKIRLIVQAPIIGKTRIAEMVSEDHHFKVALYYPDDKRSFLLGTNEADYTRWREKLGKDKQSPLANARPFHFTEALLMRPLHLGEAQFAYSLEEALQDEPDTRQGAKKGVRVLRSYYVISEVELPASGQMQSHTLRRFWFDRTDNVRFARQQLFDARGNLITEVNYSNYQKLSPERSELWPSVVLVSRPRDGYGARFTFGTENFEVNPELPGAAFVLENKENLRVTDLDKPESK